MAEFCVQDWSSMVAEPKSGPAVCGTGDGSGDGLTAPGSLSALVKGRMTEATES